AGSRCRHSSASPTSSCGAAAATRSRHSSVPARSSRSWPRRCPCWKALSVSSGSRSHTTTSSSARAASWSRRTSARRRAERPHTGGPPARAAPLMNLAELECRAGEWQRAIDYALEGEALAREWGNEDLEGVILSALAWVRAHLGEVDAARAEAERGSALMKQEGNTFFVARNERVLGFLELSLGNYAAAHARLGPSVERLDAMVGEPSVIAVVPNEIEALLGLGELDQAEAILTRLEARGRALDRPWGLASAARCRALLEAARGDVHAAEAAFACGFAALERLVEPFEGGRSLRAAGT